jgi:hypothetical protein
LNERTTNQRLYKVIHDPSSKPDYRLTDLTSRFWHKGIDPLRED